MRATRLFTSLLSHRPSFTQRYVRSLFNLPKVNNIITRSIPHRLQFTSFVSITVSRSLTNEKNDIFEADASQKPSNPTLIKLDAELLVAMKAKQKEKVAAIRKIKTQITYKAKEKDNSITEEDVAKTLYEMYKQAQETEGMMEGYGRQDLAQKEHTLIETLQDYLPNLEQLRQKVEQSLKETGVTSMKEIKKVIEAMSKNCNKTELVVAKILVKEALIPPPQEKA